MSLSWVCCRDRSQAILLSGHNRSRGRKSAIDMPLVAVERSVVATVRIRATRTRGLGNGLDTAAARRKIQAHAFINASPPLPLSPPPIQASAVPVFDPCVSRSYLWGKEHGTDTASHTRFAFSLSRTLSPLPNHKTCPHTPVPPPTQGRRIIT